MVNIIKEIYAKYRLLALPVKASLWFVICNCTLKAVQIVTTPIYTRILTSKEYGEYSIFLSWIELVAIFTSLDIYYSGYNVGMTKFLHDRKKYTAAMQGLCITITTFWFILYLLNKSIWCNFFGMKEIQVTFLFIYMFIMPIYQFWSARQRFDYKYKSLFFVTIFSSFFTILLGTYLALSTKDKSTSVIFSKIFVEGMIAIPLLIINVKNIKYIFNKYYWRYALKYNIPLIPHYLSTMILNQSDRIMIMNICGPSEAAVYSVAYSIAILISIIQSAITNAFTPWLFKKLKNKKYDNIVDTTNLLILFIGFLNLILIALAPEIINLMAPMEYRFACYIIPPVSLGTYLTFIYGIFVNIELYYENNKVTAIASFSAAIINIILNLIFIRIFGYIAAGYTTFICYLFLTIFHYLGMRKIMKNSIKYEIICIQSIIKITLIICLIAIVMLAFYHNFLIRYSCIIIFIILFIYKRNSISQLIKNIKK